MENWHWLHHLHSQIVGFGVALLDGVDPNPANFVGAGVIHTKNTQVGCLLRLEPNAQAQVKAHTRTHNSFTEPSYSLCNCVCFLIRCTASPSGPAGTPCLRDCAISFLNSFRRQPFTHLLSWSHFRLDLIYCTVYTVFLFYLLYM